LSAPLRTRARLLASLLAATAALAGCGGAAGGGGAAHGGRWAVADPLPDGLAGRPAPAIRLADARGGTFDTRSLAGRPYLVTFLYTNCPDVCPLIGDELRQALADLGPQGRRVTAVAVSVDPRHDDAAAVRTWLSRHREPPQFHYLIGSQQALTPVWKAWFASPQIAGDPQSAHTAIVWLVDARGRLAANVSAGVAFDPRGLAHDVGSLLPASRS
jgi:protein SCO1